MGLSSLILWCTLIPAVLAGPSVSYGFNDQLPPIARYDQPYSYKLASDTFTSGDPNMKIAAEGLPDWLEFDDSSRTLSGTPQATNNNRDDQTFAFNLTATDSAGSATCQCWLVVSNNPSPDLKNSSVVVDTLMQSGSIAGTNGLFLTPGQGFIINFGPDLFHTADGATRDKLQYSGLMSDHTPLPNWLQFDPYTVTFTGQAPAIQSQIAPAQSYNLSVIVSDYSGYSANQIAFNVLIGEHTFVTKVTSDSINATHGRQIRYQVPIDKVSLDNEPLQMANVSSITLNDTTWLSVSNSTGVLTGTPPRRVNGTQNVQVTITNKYQDQVDYTLHVNVGGSNQSVFTTPSIGMVNATIGKYFSYSLNEELLSSDVSVNASVDPTQNWLNYHQDNVTFNGWVPDSFKESTVTLTAEDTDGELEKASFTLMGVKAAVASPTHSATSTPSATASSAAKSGSSGGGTSNKTIAIVCGVVIPVLVLMALGILLCCWRTRRKAEEQRREESKSRISPPQMLESGVGGVVGGDKEKNAGLGIGESPNTIDTQWEPPQKISALNFMKMDSSVEEFYSGEETHVDTDTAAGNSPMFSAYSHSPALTAHSPALSSQSPAMSSGPSPVAGNNSPQVPPPNAPMAVTSSTPTRSTSTGAAGAAATAAAAAAVAQSDSTESGGDYDNDDTIRVVHPRNSWRMSQIEGESEGRWQEHRSLGSLATISTDELLTMRLVDRNSAASSDPNSRPDSATTAGGLSVTRSRILSTPAARDSAYQSTLPRDESSGIIQQLGSHSSSLMPRRDESATSFKSAEYGDTDDRPPTRSTIGHPSDHELYRTATSGDEEYDDFSDSDNSLPPNNHQPTPSDATEMLNRWSFIPHSVEDRHRKVDSYASTVRGAHPQSMGDGETPVRVGETPQRRVSESRREGTSQDRDRLNHGESAEVAFL
uniref:ARAD1C29194p n=1 Tax=Blastobotrys adeninivorans TaxID=409370 RepID=A0A060T8G7_BLAAD